MHTVQQHNETASGAVIATPENIDRLLALPDPPKRVWWAEAEIEMCLVPAGEFTMGTREQDLAVLVEQHGAKRELHVPEVPQHTLYLPAYYIGRMPVTNAQYATFAQPANSSLQGNNADHPIVNVSWYDAVRYCQWLAQTTGTSCRLPSEAEWEKAARGTDGRIYPWGDVADPRRANYDETGLGRTSAVGRYPGGASPYGCLDMSGNVWEWTRSLWGEDLFEPAFTYPYDPADGRENARARKSVLRIVRGGSFYGNTLHARCACRYRNQADGNWRNFGFRVCLALQQD